MKDEDIKYFLTILEQPTTANKAEQGQALAESYGKKGFRDYLENAIKHTCLGVLALPKEEVDYQRGRLSVLKELLGICKQSFQDFEKISKIKLE